MPPFVGISFQQQDLYVVHREEDGELLSDFLAQQAATGPILHNIFLQLLKALDLLHKAFRCRLQPRNTARWGRSSRVR